MQATTCKHVSKAKSSERSKSMAGREVQVHRFIEDAFWMKLAE